MKSHNILVAEDDVTIADVLTYGLERGGYHVEVASDGWEAWLKVQHRMFEAIITDECMPNWNGLEFCRATRSLARYARTPVIIISGNASEVDVSNLPELHIAAVLQKPFNVYELLDLLHEALSEKVPSSYSPHLCGVLTERTSAW